MRPTVMFGTGEVRIENVPDARVVEVVAQAMNFESAKGMAFEVYNVAGAPTNG